MPKRAQFDKQLMDLIVYFREELKISWRKISEELEARGFGRWSKDTIRNKYLIYKASKKASNREVEDANLNDENTTSQCAETVSKVFQLLEKEKTLPQIVIQLKLDPDVVWNLYNKWVELKQIDSNQPNLQRLDQKLTSHMLSHYEIDALLQQAKRIGSFRKDNCNQINPDGSCKLWKHRDEDDSRLSNELSELRCALCKDFRSGGDEGKWYYRVGIPRATSDEEGSDID